MTLGVIQSTVHFCCQHTSHELDGIVDNPMHLGHTAHSVGILNTTAVLMTLCETKIYLLQLW